MIVLRDYQQELINECLKEMKNGKRKLLLVSPTGSGKTATASEIIRRSYNKGKRSIFICHRQELIRQTYGAYQKIGLTPSVIQGNVRPDYSNPLQIASINTLVRRLDKVQKPDLIVFDECQHCRSQMWNDVADHYSDIYQLGLSATPCRLDGKPLNPIFEDMIQVVTVKQLIQRGYLSPYLYYAPSIIDTSELKIGSNGDYTQNSLAHGSFNARIVGDNIEQYKRLAMGKRNVVFAINRTHAQSIVNRYNDAGIKAELLDGLLSSSERKKMIERFESGETPVIVSIDVISEGFDLPAIEVVSLLRPTASTSLYLQQVGRGLRIFEGKKTALILDHVNNYQRHGMPDDDREWSLEGGLVKRKRGETSTIKIKRCPHCFFAHPPALVCPNCGYKYEANGKDIKEIAGDLVLLGSPEALQAEKKEVIIADNLKELVRIEKDRGYKFGWAEREWIKKTHHNLWGSFEGIEQIAQARGYNSGWVWFHWNKRKKG